MPQSNLFQKKRLSRALGFTFIEVVLTVGLFSLLLTMAVSTLQPVQQSASIDGIVQTLVSELNQQQLKAMLGETVDGNTYSYGIYFTANQYVLFKGNTYNVSDADNITVTLEPNIALATISFPSGQIVFNQLSGEVANFSSSQNSLLIKSLYTNQEKTLTINKFGVVSVN